MIPVAKIARAVVVSASAPWLVVPLLALPAPASPRTAAAAEMARPRRARVTLLERELAVVEPVHLVARVQGIDVSVRTGGNGSVALEATVEADTESAAREAARGLTCSASSEGPEVRVECGEPAWADDPAADSRPDVVPPRGALDVTVPESARVTISSAGGRVTIRRLAGRADLETGGGDAVLGRMAGAVSVRSGDGDVWLERVDDGPVVVETEGGGVGVESSTAPLEIRTGAGEIMVGLAAAARTELVSDSGDVTVVVSRNVGVEFDASGRFVVLGQSLPLKAFLTKHHGEGRIGDGGPSLTVDSPGGCIRIGSTRDFDPEGGIGDVCRKLAEEEERRQERDDGGAI